MTKIEQNLPNIMSLVKDMILQAEKDDREFKKEMHRIHRSSKTEGESFMLYHLKVLKELIDPEGLDNKSIYDPNETKVA